MLWPIYVAAALLLVLGSARRERIGLLLIVAGLFSVSLAKVGLSEPAFWVWSALVWIVAGAAIGRLGNRQTAVAGLLLVVAGACVFPARLMGAAYEIGQPWLVVSDLLGILAMLVLGAGAVRRAGLWVYRTGHMGAGDRRGNPDGVFSGEAASREKA